MAAAVDVTGAVTAINEAIAAIANVAVAVLTVMAALHVYRWVRGALDDYSSAGDHDCPECGGYMMESDDPEVGDTYCTDCGFTDMEGVAGIADEHDMEAAQGVDLDPFDDNDDIEFQCPHCGWEAYSDDAINAINEEFCTKCGEVC